MAESTKDVDRTPQKKVPIDNLSREELAKKCKSLLIISQKAKQAKDEATEELKTVKHELNIRCQESEKHKLCSEKLAIQLKKVAEEKENVLLAVESIKLNNGELQNIVRNISTERDALFEEVNHLNLEKQKLLKVLASTGEENDSTIEENCTLKAEKRKLNDELFASVSLQNDTNSKIKDLKVKLNNLLVESRSVGYFLQIEESSATTTETFEDTDEVENVCKLVSKFSENFHTIASHIKAGATFQERLTKEDGDGLESDTTSGSGPTKQVEEVERLRGVLEKVQSKAGTIEDENRRLKEQFDFLQSEHDKCQLSSKDAEISQIEFINEIDSLRQASSKKTTEIALLKDEISLLMERNKEQVVNLMEMKGLRNEIHRLEGLVTDKESEMKLLTEEAASSEISSQQHFSERQDFDNKIKHLQNALDNRELETANLKEKIQIAEEIQLKYPLEIEALGKEITDLKAVIEEKQVERNRIDEQVLQFSMEIKSLKSEISICQTELEAKNQEIAVMKQETVETEEKTSNSSLESDRLHKEIERLKTLLDGKGKELERIREDVAATEMANANYRSEVEALKCELSDVQKLQKETDCESDNFEKTLLMCTVENTALKCEKKSLQDHLQEKDEKMFSLAQEREILEQDNVRSCSAIEALERNVANLKQKLNDKDQEIVSLTQESKDIEENNLKYASEITTLRSEISKLQKVLEDGDRKLSAIKKERNDMEKNEEKLSSDNDQLRNEVKSLKNTIQEKDKNIGKAEENVCKYMAEIGTLKNEVINLQKNLEESKHKMASITQEREEIIENNILSHSSGIEALQKEVSNVHSTLEKKETELTNLKTSLTEYEVEMSNMKVNLQEKELEMSNALESLAVKELKISNLHASLKEQDLQISNLQASLVEKEMEISKVQASLSEKEHDIQILNTGITGKGVEISNVQTRLTEKELLITNLETSLEEKNQVISNFQASLVERELDISNLQASLAEKIIEMSNVHASLAEKQREVKSLHTSATESEVGMSDMKTTLTKRDQTISSLEGVVAERALQISNLTANLEEKKREISKLQASLTEREEQLSSVSNEKETLESRYSACSTDVEALRKQVSGLENQLELKVTQTVAGVSEAALTRVSSDLEAMKAVETEAAVVKRENAELLGEMNEMNQVLKKRGESVSKLEQANNELEQKVKETETSLAAALRDLRANVSELESSREENIRLSAEVATLSEQATLKESDNRELSEEVGRLRGRMQQLEREIKEGGCDTTSEAASCGSCGPEAGRDLEDSFEDRYTRLRAVAVRLKRRGAELSNRVEGLEADKAGLQARLGRAEAGARAVQTMQAECDRLQDELEAGRREAGRLGAELGACAASRLALETQVKQLETEMEKAKKETDASLLRCERALREEERRHSDTRAELEARRQETVKNGVLCLEMEAYERSTTDLGQKLEAERARVQELTSSLDRRREVADGLNERIGLLESELTSEQARSEEVNLQLAVLRSRLSEAAAVSSEREADIARLRSQVEVHREEAEKTTLLLSSVAADKLKGEEAARIRGESLATQVRQLQDELCSCRSRLAESTAELARLSAEFEGYKVRAHSVLQRQKAARPLDPSTDVSDRDDCVEEMARLRLAADAARAKLDETSSMLSSATTETASLQRERDRLLERCRETADRVAELTAENRRLADVGREEAAKQRLHADMLTRCHRTQLEELEERLGAENAQLRGRLEAAERRQGGGAGFVPVRLGAEIEAAMPEREEGEGSESVDSSSPLNSTQGRHELMPLDKLLATNSDDEAVQVTSSSPAAELAKTLDRLNMSERQVRHLSALLAEAEQDLARLNQLNDVLKEEIRRNQRSEEREKHAHNQEYLKNVIVKFVTLQGGDERSRLVPVLNTLLKLSPDETKQLTSVARGGAEVGGGRGWGNYLHLWPSTQ